MVVMDKSGRFMCFSAKGEYKGLLAEIDAYLANGFCIKDNAALMAISGVVLDQVIVVLQASRRLLVLFASIVLHH